MSRRYQQGCLYRESRKAGPDVWVSDGETNRKEKVGTVEQFPTKSKALKACELIRANINRETRSPRTVAELVSYYRIIALTGCHEESLSQRRKLTTFEKLDCSQVG